MKTILCALILLGGGAALLPASEAQKQELRGLQLQFDRAANAREQAAAARMVHPDYLYVAPEAGLGRADVPLAERLGIRLKAPRFLTEDSEIRLAGDTAIVAGTFVVTDPKREPRFVERGRFTATWVRESGVWRLLAEQRAFNLNLEWAAPGEIRPTAPELPAPAIARRDEGVPAESPGARAAARIRADDAESRVQLGLLPAEFAAKFRAYEPNVIGLTWDDGDEQFMDFTFSAMFPLVPVSDGGVFAEPHRYPPPVRLWRRSVSDRALRYGWPSLYFAGNIRAGQYIETRPSSPVVGKRFNPLLALRFWARDGAGELESEDNFLEFSLGHESNGQYIASEARFLDQVRTYSDTLRSAAPVRPALLRDSLEYRSARDNISRGWDYVGMQFARDWDTTLPWAKGLDATVGVRARFNYFLRTGPAQGEAEEYNSWEDQAGGKRRQEVDGLSWRTTLTVGRPPRGAAKAGGETGWRALVKPERRYAVTLTTGYAQPFRYTTVRVEAGLTLLRLLPVTVWYRHGYNSDLIDYYRADRSFGFSLTYWTF